MGGEVCSVPNRHHLGEILLKPNILPLHLLSAPKLHPVYRYDSACFPNDLLGNFQLVAGLFFADFLVRQ